MSRAAEWIPPAKVMRLVIVLVTVLVAIALVGLWWGGANAAVASVLGAVSVLILALKQPPWWHTVVLGLVTAAGASAATVVAGSSWGLGLVVAATVLATTPLVLRHGAIVSSTPVVVALAGMEASSIGPAAAAAGIIAAALLMVLAVALLRLSIPLPPAQERAVLLAYVGILALGSGLAVGVVTALGISHGYWVVIALTAVLVPVAGETTSKARGRIAGTVAGAIIASGLALVLPGAFAAVVAALSLLLGIAWTVMGSQARGAGLTAVAIVLLSSAGAAAEAWEVAGERALLTLAGGVFAAVLGLAFARFDRREEALEADRE
ncbi:FUSC family protein [Demequina sp. NBRC 110054]|uniref:FUSC family protein n=1 Tax=Demequina sp. NBRC 110054 TaxID=1570343 RepID=UPI0009FCCA4A|nr:FUSC family protein [Demequina sp. NBRC 110054]